jgi:signal transduction histidine kinase
MTSFTFKWAKYGLALVAVLAAFVARFLLEPILGAVAPLILFSLAVTLSAWYGGFGPGIVATVACVLLGDYYFIEPLHSFRISSHNRAQLLELILFLLTGVAISMISQMRITSEAKRQQLLIREKEARVTAEVANRHKDEFLAAVSHELRTPLTAILGWSVMLRKGILDREKMDHAAETIERNARTQMRLIDDLLDVSKIISGNLQLVCEPMTLTPTIEAAAEVVRPLADAKEVQLCLELHTVTGRVMGDPTRLQQVIWNLLTNAVKFTPSGGRVDVTLDQVGPQARITVCDTGKGISTEFLPYVFDRFRQANTKSGGMGLGLAIARSLVELHGGTIEVFSAGEGHGTTCKVYISLLESGNHTFSPDQSQPGA